MGQTRWQKLETIALEGMSEEHKLILQPMVRATARMIAEATKPKEKRAKDPEATADFTRGQWVIDALKQRAKELVAWEPVQPRTVVALGKACRECNTTAMDLVNLGWWLRDGGLHWMTETPTVSYLARNFADLVAKARAAQGKQEASALDRVRER